MEQQKQSAINSGVGNGVNYSLEGGRLVANALPGEEVVISGISGAFPSSRNIGEFKENLFNKINMVSPCVRWDTNFPEIPVRRGEAPEIEEYDLGFFGVHERQSHSLDVLLSLVQEKTVEAIFDAGLHPSDLENTKTGVYVGTCFSESQKPWFFDKLVPESYTMTGLQKGIIPHRLSYFLKLKGPSHLVDTACSSSLFAFENAYRAIRTGEVDAAIVAGTHVCLHPFLTVQFYRLGVLSKDGFCKPFDEQGDGYTRSDAVVVLLLQKAKDAKRIYSEVVYAKTNSDGYKEQGVTFPSRGGQRGLLHEFYAECGVDKSSLSYLEAHATGTLVGDPEECAAIDEVFAPGRKSPLLIGSVKSNIGHSEPSSGVVSIIKAIIGMETGLIPPNINYNKPRAEIKGIIEGRMKVVTEPTPLEDEEGLIGVNCFGFGGANCHVLLRRNPKTNRSRGRKISKDNLPKLVCLSGRTEQAVTCLLDSLTTNEADSDYVKLLHDVFRKNVEGHIFRGYSIVSSSGEIMRSLKFLKHFPGNSPQLYCIFGELKGWYNIGCDLMILPAFSTFIERVQKILGHKVNIVDVLLKKSPNGIGHLFGSVVIQIGVSELLKLLEISPVYTFENYFGELIYAYCDGSISLEEAVNYTYFINKALISVNGAVDTSIEYKVTNVLKGNNMSKSVSMSQIDQKAKNHLLKAVLKELESAVDSNNNSIKGMEHFANALLNRTSRNTSIPLNSTVLQICDKSIDKLEDIPVIPVFSRSINNFVQFLDGIGSLYESGYNPQISKLYPPVEYPVGRGTQMMSPYIKWNHRKQKFVPHYDIEITKQSNDKKITVSVETSEWSFIRGHVVDGRNLFPAAGYLYLVWEMFVDGKNLEVDMTRVCFENCRFISATMIPKQGFLYLQISIQKGSGYFEVISGESLVVSGRISFLRENTRHQESSSKYNTLFDTDRSELELKSDDFYKELRLRGYHYKDKFRAVVECNTSATKAVIKWENNWTTFMDNMLQMKILEYDTRLIYVPTFISKLTIMAKKHLDFVKDHTVGDNETTALPVISDPDSGEIRCGGIQISGLVASSIARRRTKGIPVLESYRFVPNFTLLETRQSVRVNMQIILENSLSLRVQAVELVDEFSNKDTITLMPIVMSVLEDQPLVQPLLKILSKDIIEDIDIEVENKKLVSETKCLLVIASSIFDRPMVLEEASNALLEDGFIIARESHQCDTSKCVIPDFSIFTIHRTPNETIFLLRKKTKAKKSRYIKIDSTRDFSWIPKVQNYVVKENNEDVVLYAEKEPTSGILGLVNCMRREPQGRNVKCLFMMDDTERFDPDVPFFAGQLDKQMAHNVYKNGQWGTYRHLLLEKPNIVESEHCYINTTVRGDLSSLRWIEGSLQHHMTNIPEKDLIHVYYCGLNFRDIMTASGKINVDMVTRDRVVQENVQGVEFSGRDTAGNRIMGMMPTGALASLVLDDTYIKFAVPDSWTLEEAATIPAVYSTVVYCLIIRGHIMKGESILIHSGTGGVGQAAIRIALHYGCRVFTTVGTKEKREFLKATFPQLKDHHIGNSRDESFEQMIWAGTHGRGVDLVLNSLAEEKLVASLRCLAKGGRFLEIGKVDMISNRHVSTLLFQKEASFHGIMLDQLLLETPQVKNKLKAVMDECIVAGAIRPLNRTVFKYDEVEKGYRYMATGKHMGKVLIQVRKPENELVIPPKVTKFPGMARYFCDPEKVYIIAGGLGGFGLELADWLIVRGAQKIVLVSRKGVVNGYQSYRLRIWQMYGIFIKISTTPITTREGCKQLIEESSELGCIDAIFNLAVVLSDSTFENQTPESFTTSFTPKAYATEYLDQLTRKMCPKLRQFVIFSSVTCGRGNIGQTNYGMANSVMERICEYRRKAGFPALAVQWGAVGEVGLVAEMFKENIEMEVGGTLQQSISSCLQVLDTLLRQKEATIVSSMVVAVKRGAVAENVVDAVISILGLTDAKAVSPHSTLAEIGMDSMTAVEIKQVLERDFEIFLSAKDMRTMTLARLREIQDERLSDEGDDRTVALFGIEMLFRQKGDKELIDIPYQKMKSSISQDAEAPTLLLFPGVEGLNNIYQDLTKKIKAHTVGIQYSKENDDSIIEMAQAVIAAVEKHCPKNNFLLVAYSYGSLIALEVIKILEARGYSGTVIFIDGSPLVMKQLAQNLGIESDKIFQTAVLCQLLSLFITQEQIGHHKEKIFKCTSWDERMKLGEKILQSYSCIATDDEKRIANSIYKRSQASWTYVPTRSKLKTTVKLLKPTQPIATGFPEEYGLSEYFEKPIEVQTFQGNHMTLLDNEAVAIAINSYIEKIAKCDH